MFIRKVVTRHRSSGGSYYSFRLCHTLCTPAGMLRIHLLNLGAGFDLPEHRRGELVHRIEGLDSHQQSLMPPDPDLLALARRIRDLLLERDALRDDRDLDSVHLDSLHSSHLRSVGGERIALDALDRLGFRDALEAEGVAPCAANVAAAPVVARMLKPSSERVACDWLNKRSAALGLLALETVWPLALDKLYRTSDLPRRHRKGLERALCRRERELFQTPSTLAFVDLANVHFHGPRGDDRQFGSSRQRRNDCPLVTLAP